METNMKEDTRQPLLSDFVESIYKSQREMPYYLSNNLVDGVYLHLGERVSFKDKYWTTMKNQLQISYVMTRRIMKKTAKNKEVPNELLQKERKSIRTEKPITKTLVEQGAKPCTKPCIKICSMPCHNLDVKQEAETKTETEPDIIIPKSKPRIKPRKKFIEPEMLQDPEIFPKLKIPKPVMRPILKKEYMSEKDWFMSKYEKEISDSPPPPSMFSEVSEIINKYIFRGIALLPLAKIIEFALKYRAQEEKIAVKNFLLDQQQKPSDDVPAVKWSGPLIRRCGCDLGDCDCRGDILLPSKFVPTVKRPTAKKGSDNWYTPDRKNNLVQRLLKQLNAQEYLYTELEAMGVLDQRGDEFCPYRCLHYSTPLAAENSKYFGLRRKLLQSFKAKQKEPKKNGKSNIKKKGTLKRKAETVIVAKRKISMKQTKKGKKRKRKTKSKGKSRLEPAPEEAYDVIPEPAPAIEIKGKSWVERLEESLPSYYTNQSTQYAVIDQNGEFILDDFSHIVFANLRGPWCHVEGQELNVDLHTEPFKEELHIGTKFKKVFNAQNIISSILSQFLHEDEDTGVPVKNKRTQDPPLDDHYVSIINTTNKSIPRFRGPCICCELYNRYYDGNVDDKDEDPQKKVTKKKTCFCDTESKIVNVDKTCIKNKKETPVSNCNNKHKNLTSNNITKEHKKTELKSCVKNIENNVTSPDSKSQENTKTVFRNDKSPALQSMPIYFVDKCNQLNYLNNKKPSQTGSKLRIKQSISSATNFIKRINVFKKKTSELKLNEGTLIEANVPSRRNGK